MMIEDTLKERGTRYGTFESNAEVCQELKALCRRALIINSSGLFQPGNPLDDEKKLKTIRVVYEAIEMICHKLSRIVNGDPCYPDSWVDIAGYAQLVVNYLKRIDEEKKEE